MELPGEVQKSIVMREDVSGYSNKLQFTGLEGIFKGYCPSVEFLIKKYMGR